MIEGLQSPWWRPASAVQEPTLTGWCDVKTCNSDQRKANMHRLKAVVPLSVLVCSTAAPYSAQMRIGDDPGVENKMKEDEVAEQPAPPPVSELADDAWFDEVLVFFDHLDTVIEVVDPAAADGRA